MKYWVLILLGFALSGCSTTWNVASDAVFKSDQTATITQQGIRVPVYILKVDGQSKGWGHPTTIKVSEGTHVIGFTVHPLFYTLIPDESVKNYSFIFDSLYYWVVFQASRGHQYHISYEITKSENNKRLLLVQIIDSNSGKVCSQTIGNFPEPPLPTSQKKVSVL